MNRYGGPQASRARRLVAWRRGTFGRPRTTYWQRLPNNVFFVLMGRSGNHERAIIRWSAALAVAAACTVFVASFAKANLLLWIIGSGTFLPIAATVFGVRIAAGLLAFFGPERPSATRTVRAVFLRDDWLADHLKRDFPRTILAFGAVLMFFRLAILAALALAALCVFLNAMSLAQAVSVFVVCSFLLIGYQAVGGTYLIFRQIYELHAGHHA